MSAYCLSEEQAAIAQMAREFGEKEIRPLGEKLDRSRWLLDDFPWALVRKGSELGLRLVGLPQEHGGLELDCRSQVVLIDELAYHDVACARMFSLCWNLGAEIVRRGSAAQQREFLARYAEDDGLLLAGTPPARQAGRVDTETGNEAGSEAGKEAAAPALVASHKRDHYLLNGTASCVLLAPVAKLFLVEAETGGETGIFLVPGDTPGVAFSRLTDTFGARLLVAGDIVFDNARVPTASLLGGKEGQGFSERFIAAADIETSAHAMALARVALDAATAYANERIQGGRRIIEHQAVALALADMYIPLQAGRSMVWRAASELDNGRIDPAFTAACKNFCTEAAIAITRNAVELFGGSGVMRELPMQKYFRDAVALTQLAGGNGADRIAAGAIVAGAIVAGGEKASPERRSLPAPDYTVRHMRQFSPVEHDLTPEQQALKAIAREFCDSEIRPLAAGLDRSQSIFRDFPWQLIENGSQLGLRTLSVPREYGGPEASLTTWLVVIEELGRADISCAKIFSQCWKLCRRLAQAGTDEQKQRFLPAFCEDDRYLLSGASTEPGSGSDNHLPYDAPNAGVMMSAERAGDHYVLNGTKHFVSLAPIAKLLFVTARTDKTVGTSVGTSTFLVPRGIPGMSCGAVHDKLGLRIYFQGEFSFDNARVPLENLLGGREGYTGFDGAASNIELAAYAVVVARAALDAAIEHAGSERRGGKPLLAHESVQAKIGEMYQELEAARSLLWRATWLADQGRPDRSLTMSAKVLSTEMAVKVCFAALELCGRDGISQASPLQKFARDAVALPHMDATNPINKIKIAKVLNDWISGRLPEWGATLGRY